MARLSEIKNILKAHNLSVTDRRIEVLKYLLSIDGTIAFKKLESVFTSFDRVTLYRTLKAFSDKDLIHRIPNDGGIVTYGISVKDDGSANYDLNHMHFKCTECGKIECLKEHVPSIEVPGYLIRHVDLILRGICRVCIA